ncbi:hypothetical protein TNCV_3301411 [Trichonephila clavipes]|nr:hypothetical protein TNCV_3301411 [Trichonephila clavipes]
MDSTWLGQERGDYDRLASGRCKSDRGRFHCARRRCWSVVVGEGRLEQNCRAASSNLIGCGGPIVTIGPEVWDVEGVPWSKVGFLN